MFEFFSTLSPENALSILKQDHETVKEIFNEFEKAEDKRRKLKLVEKAITELKIHAAIEEEIFYPAVRPEMEKDIMNEANEEHHVAKLLIAELDQMDGSEEHFDAKFIVLAENIRHHVKEEEGEMFPHVRALDIDLEALGRKMLARKESLKRNGIPASDEEKLIKRAGIADSPAKAAEKGSKRKARTAPAAGKRRSAVVGKLVSKRSGAAAKRSKRA